MGIVRVRMVPTFAPLFTLLWLFSELPEGVP
jgi:hypothetical protein